MADAEMIAIAAQKFPRPFYVIHRRELAVEVMGPNNERLRDAAGVGPIFRIKGR